MLSESRKKDLEIMARRTIQMYGSDAILHMKQLVATPLPQRVRSGNLQGEVFVLYMAHRLSAIALRDGVISYVKSKPEADQLKKTGIDFEDFIAILDFEIDIFGKRISTQATQRLESLMKLFGGPAEMKRAFEGKSEKELQEFIEKMFSMKIGSEEVKELKGKVSDEGNGLIPLHAEIPKFFFDLIKDVSREANVSFAFALESVLSFGNYKRGELVKYTKMRKSFNGRNQFGNIG